MKRSTLFTLIATLLATAVLLFAAARRSGMLPLIIVFELVLLFAFGLRFVMIYKAFSKEKN